MFNVVITMAGEGKRFRDAGYKIPKFMIDVEGKTLFEWSMESLRSLNKEFFYFITRKEYDASYFIKEKCDKLGISNFKIIELEEKTLGQAQTAMYAINECNLDDEIFIYNIDTYANPNFIRREKLLGDGGIPCFNADGEHWSFVKLNENNIAVEVTEKKRISEHASIGAYYFKKASDFIKAYNLFYIEQKRLEKGERYVAPLYNELIKDNKEITIIQIPTNEVVVLGTPAEVEEFKLKNNNI